MQVRKVWDAQIRGVELTISLKGNHASVAIITIQVDIISIIGQ